ncbi:MAG: hypothetical protein IKE38_02490, partial [Erysipelotrichaceae bacterium]|nr:hypothetical protein [Erysipelotrichaceae bacterium]
EVDIPDFGNKHDDNLTDEIDRSVFKMDDDDDYYDDEYDDEPKYRKVKQPVIIATAVILALMVALAIVGWVFGLSKNKAYKTLKADYDQYVTKATATESALNSRITELEKQISDMTSGTTPSDPGSGSAAYQVAATSGLAVRSGASANNGFADYDKLPEDIRNMCDADNGAVYINYGSIINVLETYTENYSEGTRVWGRIADNAWVCLKTNGDDYCIKQ